MRTVFVPTWSMSVLLVLLAATVIWCAINASNTNWDVVSGNHDESEKCGDQVEIETEDGPMILTCDKDKHGDDEEHGALTVDEEYVNSWRWAWTQ